MIFDRIRQVVRGIMDEIAMAINEFTAGRVKPSHVTALSTVMHVVIGAAIILGSYQAAALLLVVFGMMDALDGSLARLQKSASDTGMILDATSDRIKEILRFSAITFVFAESGASGMALLSVLALGGSIIVSYVKAKAETVVATKKDITSAQANRIFGGGLFPYEVRMLVLVIGLIVARLDLAVIVIAIGSWFTLIERSRKIWQALASK